MTLIYMTINFVVFLVIMFFLLKKPLVSFLIKRRATFIDSSKKSEEIFANAKAKMDETNYKMKRINIEGNDFINQSVATAENNARNMISEAERYAKYSVEEAKRIVEAEERSAQNKIKNDFISMIIEDSRDELITGVDNNAMNKYIDGAGKK